LAGEREEEFVLADVEVDDEGEDEVQVEGQFEDLRWRCFGTKMSPFD
jgi:hypothetical protein